MFYVYMWKSFWNIYFDWICKEFVILFVLDIVKFIFLGDFNN